MPSQRGSLLGRSELTAMRALTSEVVAVIFAVSIPVVAMTQGPLEAPMVAIDGGSYPIGSADGPASTGPLHRVTLDPFLIDVYEVTNAQFATFLNTLEVTAKRDVRAGVAPLSRPRPRDCKALYGSDRGNQKGARRFQRALDRRFAARL